MTYRIIYARAARADLREIANYFRKAADDVIAQAVANKIIEKVETLGIRPTRHRSRSELSPGLRALPVGNYLIFYRVDDEIVSIIRILHGARNITAKLFPPVRKP